MGWPGDPVDPPSGNTASAVLASGLTIVALGVLLLLPGWTSGEAKNFGFLIILSGLAISAMGAVLVVVFVRDH